MSKKKTFVTLEQLKEIDKTYPTPYHLYDEKGIRENAKRLKEAFSWNKGYREYFAVKATPNPYILKILKDYGCGVDCASMAELMMGYALDYKPEEIMFSSNDTPAVMSPLKSQSIKANGFVFLHNVIVLLSDNCIVNSQPKNACI